MPIPGAIALRVASGQATALGNTALVSPEPTRRVRLHYCSYNPTGAAEVGFRFGAAGEIFLRNDLTAQSVIAKDFGDSRYVEGGVGETLFLNQSAAVTTNWTVFYEVAP